MSAVLLMMRDVILAVLLSWVGVSTDAPEAQPDTDQQEARYMLLIEENVPIVIPAKSPCARDAELFTLYSI